MALTSEQIAAYTNKAQGAAGVGNIATGLYSIYQGILDKREYKKLAKDLVRPIFEIPEAATEAYNLAKNLAAPKTTALDDIAFQKAQAASAVGASRAVAGSTSSQDLLAAMTGLNAKEQEASAQIVERALTDYNRRQQQLMDQQAQMAQWQMKKQEFDKLDPFYEKAAAISALRNSSEQNIAGGFGNVAQGATSLAQAIALGGLGG